MEELSQDQPINELSKKDADVFAAALAFATNLSRQFIQPAQNPENAPEVAKNESGGVPEQAELVKEEPVEENALQGEIETIREDIKEIKGLLKTDEKTEIESLKKQIQEVLKEDGE